MQDAICAGKGLRHMSEREKLITLQIMVRLCSALVILGFLSLLHVVPCNVLTKLTKDESEHNAEHCGYNFINRKTHHSSDRGDKKEVKQELFINQYPWIANIRVRDVESNDDQDPWDSQISAEDSPWNDDEKWDMCELKYVHTSFVDLRSYRRWICSTTGVCPKDAESASDGEFEDRDACENSGNLPLLNSLQIFVLASILFVNNI